MYFRKKVSGGRIYLQIAESRRVGGQVRQRVITTLGRLDELEASGQMERLVRSGARLPFSPTSNVSSPRATRRWSATPASAAS